MSRLPIQPLRGTFAALTAEAADPAGILDVGELCISTDTNRVYIVEDNGSGPELQLVGDGGGGSGGITDGNKGDIIVSNGGETWTIGPASVSGLAIQQDSVTSTNLAANAVGSTELQSTSVVPGAYSNTELTIDQDGRITAAESGFPGVAEWTTGVSYEAGDKVIAQVTVDTYTDIEYVGGISVQQQGTITITGVVEGDLVILLGAADSQNLSPPSFGSTGTWTQGVPLGLDNNNVPDTMFYYQVVPAGFTSLTAGDLSNNATVHVMVAFRGCDPNALFGTGSANSATGSPNPPAVTTTIPESLVLAIGYLDDDAQGDQVSPPAGYSLGESEDANNGTASATIMTAYKKIAQPTVEDPGQFTSSSDATKGLSLVLQPIQGTAQIWRLFRAEQNFTATGSPFPGDQSQGINWIEVSPGGDGSIVVPSAGGATGDTEDKFKTVTADTGSATADQVNDSLAIVGGASIMTALSGDTLTINYMGGGGSNDQFLFNTIASDSGSVIAGTTAETLTIAGGTDIATSISGNTLTINYTGTGGGGGGSGITEWAKFTAGLSPDVNTSTTYTARNWLNTTPAFSAGTWSATESTITIPSAGIWQISVNWFLAGSVVRACPAVRLSVNNNLQPETALHTYIRNNSGHTETSANLSSIYSLQANDVIRVASAQTAGAGSVLLNSAQSSITLVRLA